MKRKGFKSISMMLICVILLIVLITGFGVSSFAIFSTVKNNESSAKLYRNQLEEDVLRELKNETQLAVSVIEHIIKNRKAVNLRKSRL